MSEFAVAADAVEEFDAGRFFEGLSLRLILVQDDRIGQRGAEDAAAVVAALGIGDELLQVAEAEFSKLVIGGLPGFIADRTAPGVQTTTAGRWPRPANRMLTKTIGR